jgi:SSS family solute:Na+ symporter
MNSHVFLVGFIIYALAMIWLGWYVSRHQKSGEDFYSAAVLCRCS